MNAADRLFGKGISFPPRIGEDGRVAWSSGSQNVRESIRVILTTEINERIMLPQFGCGLKTYLFKPNTVATRRLIQDRIEFALGQWEPRIALESVTVEVDPNDENTAIISINYRLIATQQRERLGMSFTFGT